MVWSGMVEVLPKPLLKDVMSYYFRNYLFFKPNTVLILKPIPPSYPINCNAISFSNQLLIVL